MSQRGDDPDKEHAVDIEDIERRLATAERQASAWGISERLREQRLAEVDDLRIELAEAEALAAGRGRRRR